MPLRSNQKRQEYINEVPGYESPLLTQELLWVLKALEVTDDESITWWEKVSNLFPIIWQNLGVG